MAILYQPIKFAIFFLFFAIEWNIIGGCGGRVDSKGEPLQQAIYKGDRFFHFIFLNITHIGAILQLVVAHSN